MPSSDISKCNWKNCPKKNQCLRFTCKSSEYQSWSDFDKVEWKCFDFEPNMKVWDKYHATMQNGDTFDIVVEELRTGSEWYDDHIVFKILTGEHKDKYSYLYFWEFDSHLTKI